MHFLLETCSCEIAEVFYKVTFSDTSVKLSKNLDQISYDFIIQIITAWMGCIKTEHNQENITNIESLRAFEVHNLDKKYL